MFGFESMEDRKIMFKAYCLKSYERPLKPYKEFIEASSEEEAVKELLKKYIAVPIIRPETHVFIDRWERKNG